MRYWILAIAIVLVGNWSQALPKEYAPDQITMHDNVYSVGASSTYIYNLRMTEMKEDRAFREEIRRFNIKSQIEKIKAENGRKK